MDKKYFVITCLFVLFVIIIYIVTSFDQSSKQTHNNLTVDYSIFEFPPGEAYYSMAFSPGNLYHDNKTGEYSISLKNGTRYNYTEEIINGITIFKFISTGQFADIEPVKLGLYNNTLYDLSGCVMANDRMCYDVRDFGGHFGTIHGVINRGSPVHTQVYCATDLCKSLDTGDYYTIDRKAWYDGDVKFLSTPSK